VPFDVWEENLPNIEFLKTLLNSSTIGTEDLVTLSRHVKITIIPTWFIMALRRKTEV